jgi:hypothetical protein
MILRGFPKISLQVRTAIAAQSQANVTKADDGYLGSTVFHSIPPVGRRKAGRAQVTGPGALPSSKSILYREETNPLPAYGKALIRHREYAASANGALRVSFRLALKTCR